MKYYIVGIHKCGTTSVKKLLESHGHEVIRQESSFWDAWKGGGSSLALHNFRMRNDAGFQKHDSDLESFDKLIFVLRDPVKRTWSHYNYKKYHQEGDRQQIHVSFEEPLFFHPELLLHSYYDYWVNLWNPDEVIWLEEMIEKHGDEMPQLTKSIYHEELTNERINLIESGLQALKKSKLKFSYFNNWVP